MARKFNGSSDRIRVPVGILGNGPMSVSCWATLHAQNASASQFLIHNGGNSTATSQGIGIYVPANSQTPNGITPGSTIITGTISLTLDVWTRLTITIPGAGGIGRLYVGAAQSISGAMGMTAISANSPGAFLNIGAESNNTQWWNGNITDPAVWNAVLSPSEVAALASGTRANNIRPKNLVSWPPFEGYGYPARDRTKRDVSGVACVGSVFGTTLVPDPPLLNSAPILLLPPDPTFIMPPMIAPPPPILMPQIIT